MNFVGETKIHRYGAGSKQAIGCCARRLASACERIGQAVKGPAEPARLPRERRVRPDRAGRSSPARQPSAVPACLGLARRVGRAARLPEDVEVDEEAEDSAAARACRGIDSE